MFDCESCRSIDLTPNNGYYQLPRSAVITQAAIDGCEWCQFFCAIAKRHSWPVHEDLTFRLHQPNAEQSTVRLYAVSEADAEWSLDLRLCDASGGYTVLRICGVRSEKHGLRISEGKEPPLDREYTAAEGRALGRRICRDPDEDACVNLAMDWLKRCRKHHGGLCESRAQNPLPTRLVNIADRDGDVLKLCITEGQWGSYAALSYVWGDSYTLRCTQRNFKKLQEGFELKRLPVLLREAIIVARRLGFDWIWIDGLCIIQSDEEDWSREASRMAQVYGNSSLTISADLSDGVDDDLFYVRNIITSPVLHKFPTMCLQTMTDGWEQITAGPLYRRGWPFQERILSTRNLHFFNDQIAWECNTTVYLEEHRGRLQKPGDHFSKSTLSGFFNHNLWNYTQPSTSSLEDLRLDPINRIGCWNAIIQEIAFKNFTQRSDTLPSVSGLASALQVPAIGTYLAGIWEKYPGISMAWYMRWPQEFEGKEYRAPSWSWAGTEGQLVWYDEPFVFSPFEGEEEWRKWIEERSPRIVEHNITTKAVDAKGEVLPGSYVVMEGRCTYMWVLEIPDTTFDPWEAKYDELSPGNPDLKAHMDVREMDRDSRAFFTEDEAKAHGEFDEARMTKYLCLEIYKQKNEFYNVALVLENSKSMVGAYKRVGLLVFKDIELVTAKLTWERKRLTLI